MDLFGFNMSIILKIFGVIVCLVKVVLSGFVILLNLIFLVLVKELVIVLSLFCV